MKNAIKLALFFLAVVFSITGCHKHSFVEGYAYDDVYHWRETTCGHDDAIIMEPHTFGSWIPSQISQKQILNLRTCSVCGFTEYDDVFFKELFIEYDDVKSMYGGRYLNDEGIKHFFGEKEKDNIYYLKEVDSYPLLFLNIPDSYDVLGAIHEDKSISETLDSFEKYGESPYCDLNAYSFVKEINISKSIKGIDIFFFEPFLALESINVSTSNSVYYSENGALFKKNMDGSDSLVLVPCNNNAFKDIPSNVADIGEMAFKNNKNIIDIVIPFGVKSIGYRSFYECSNLTSVSLPNSVTTIEKEAFSGCTSLEDISLPDSLITIGEGAFFVCSSFKSIAIPSSVTTIGKYAFQGCTNVSSITIPNSVTTIEDYAFCFCEQLTSITIPDSVIIIGEGAFDCCEKLSNIYYSGTKSQWKSVKLSEYWGYKVPATVIHCSDGDVDL